MKYKAILFDMDDTLLKTWEAKWAHHKLVGKQYYNVEVTDDMLAKHWGEPFPTLVQSLYGRPEPIEKVIENFATHEADFLKPAHDTVADTLADLQADGFILGVVTAMISSVAEDDLAREFPSITFAFIQGADHTLVHKPDPLVFEPALHKLEQLDIRKNEILYVGDALSDLYAARDAGLDFVAVTTGFVDASSFKKVGVKKALSSLAELPSVIKGGK